eukprot:TRINITY_DN118_c0_g6_i1.p1 TRINITY_DN118_c0_g6~~TRINITY_DN118_c0_g6_i1.p1  ORF type:complete len:453 (-),score=96.13 TRINITY_DN118_c0_g6_i1:11-1369(-)
MCFRLLWNFCKIINWMSLFILLISFFCINIINDFNCVGDWNNDGSLTEELELEDRNGNGKCYWNIGFVLLNEYVFEWKTVYNGEFKNGLKHGNGVFTSFSGSSYDGEWVQDKRHGSGVYYLNDGSYLKGNWLQDKLFDSKAELYLPSSNFLIYYNNHDYKPTSIDIDSSNFNDVHFIDINDINGIVYNGTIVNNLMDGSGFISFDFNLNFQDLEEQEKEESNNNDNESFLSLLLSSHYNNLSFLLSSNFLHGQVHIDNHQFNNHHLSLTFNNNNNDKKNRNEDEDNNSTVNDNNDFLSFKFTILDFKTHWDIYGNFNYSISLSTSLKNSLTNNKATFFSLSTSSNNNLKWDIIKNNQPYHLHQNTNNKYLDDQLFHLLKYINKMIKVIKWFQFHFLKHENQINAEIYDFGNSQLKSSSNNNDNPELHNTLNNEFKKLQKEVEVNQHHEHDEL